MYRLIASLLNGVWTLGMLASVAVGVQAVQNNQPPDPSKTQFAEQPIAETARPIEDNRQFSRQLVDAAVQVQGDQAESQAHQRADVSIPLTYGPNGTYITLEEYNRLHPQASPRYRSSEARLPKHHRPPTCTPSRAQIAWARMLPNHDGLAQRGLTDEQIIAYFAPSEVKALDGDELPEHLRPDTRPAVVFVNERCVDGTCMSGYCEASRRNLDCRDGRCPVPMR